MKMNHKNVLLSGVCAVLMSGCGGGGGTPTPSYNSTIAQPSLPGTVVQILQDNAGGVSAIPASSDGSYSITDTTPVIVQAQTTQGLSQSVSWGFSAIDVSGLNYAPLSAGGYKISGSTDPILQQIGFSGLATVPKVISNPTGGSPLEFKSLIAPGGTLILGLGQNLTVASAPFQANAVFRVVSAYAGNWAVSYMSAGAAPAYSGTCQINVSASGVVSGSCNDATLGTFPVTGRDYGSGNAMGLQFQDVKGVINFFSGVSPVSSNALQGKTNIFVNANSTSTGGTAGSSSNAVTSIYAVDPFACQLIPGSTFIQIANPTTCSSSYTVLFGSTTSSSSTPASPASGATSSKTSSSTGTGVPVTWTATKSS
jgi:hypothetical protein